MDRLAEYRELAKRSSHLARVLPDGRTYTSSKPSQSFERSGVRITMTGNQGRRTGGAAGRVAINGGFRNADRTKDQD